MQSAATSAAAQTATRPERPDLARTDMTRTLAVLLAGGRGTRLHELTAQECKPALWFAGTRRIVDFAMANAVRARVPAMILATQYRPDTLTRHVQSLWGRAFGEGRLNICNGPDVTGCKEGYTGTAHAVAANIARIEAEAPDEVIILAGDHIYEMDLAAMVASHRASGARATVAADTVDRSIAGAFGVLSITADGQVRTFEEKPDQPDGLPGQPDIALVSMGIYVFSWPWLRAMLLADRDQPGSAHDFGSDILPAAVAEGVAHAYLQPCREDGHKPYWRDVGTLDAYRLAQLDFAQGRPPCALPNGPGRADQLPCEIDALQYGFEITTGGLSLRAPRYRADMPGRWTVLEESVVLPGARLAPGVRLVRAIVAPGTVVPEGLVVGEDPDEDLRWFRQTQAGTTLITSAMLARRASLRPRSLLSRNAGRALFSIPTA